MQAGEARERSQSSARTIVARWFQREHAHDCPRCGRSRQERESMGAP